MNTKNSQLVQGSALPLFYSSPSAAQWEAGRMRIARIIPPAENISQNFFASDFSWKKAFHQSRRGWTALERNLEIFSINGYTAAAASGGLWDGWSKGSNGRWHHHWDGGGLRGELRSRGHRGGLRTTQTSRGKLPRLSMHWLQHVGGDYKRSFSGPQQIYEINVENSWN